MSFYGPEPEELVSLLYVELKEYLTSPLELRAHKDVVTHVKALEDRIPVYLESLKISELRDILDKCGRVKSKIGKLRSLSSPSNNLLKKLKDLVCFKVDPWKVQLEGKLRSFRTLLKKTSTRNTELKEVTDDKKREIEMVFLVFFLRKIMDLLCAGFVVPIRGQIRILRADLSVFRDSLMCLQYWEIASDLFKHIQTLSIKAGLVVCSLYDDEMNVENGYSSLVDLLEEIKIFKVPLPKISSTAGLVFFDCLLGKLRKLLYSSDPSIIGMPYPLHLLLEKLKFLRSFLTRIVDQHVEQEELKVLWTRIISTAYKTEYIIDSFLVQNGPIWHRVFWIFEVTKEIEVLKSEVISEMHDKEVQSGAEVSSQPLSEVTYPEMNEVVVGLEDEEESIAEDLVGGSRKLMTVSIVGMPGLGKTHFAKRIYNKCIIKDHFDVLAWCYVSQVYDQKNLLSLILSQVTEPIDKMPEMTNEELAEMLYKSLKGNRYLIIMDDVWDVEVWNALRRCFPDDSNGSRIIITSRSQDLDLNAACSKIHQLRPFSDDESWNLLQEKIFPKRGCASELLEVGKQIAKNCDGLPLAVVLASGILARIDKKPSQWREVANSLSLCLVGDPDKKSFKVIELSYNHLPNYLKSCFLYIGAFRHKKYIPVRKLIWLWVAEGFVAKAEQKSLEKIAENYLMDLIGRSLVTIVKRRSSGGVKKCHVHDLVRDFCVEKAKEDNFFMPIGELQTSNLSGHIIYEQRRICSNQPEVLLKSQENCEDIHCSHIRSLLFFDCNAIPASCCNVSSIFDRFRLLNVLDLGYLLFFDSYPDGLNSLPLLRFLAIRGEFESIPSTIANLKNLETFIVNSSFLEVYLPDTIWKLVKLQHLRIKYGALISHPPYIFSQLGNLQTFSTLVLSCADETYELLNGLSNVKKLRCIFLNSWDSSRKSNRLPVLDSLTQLESLNVCYKGGVLQSFKFSFPSSIKKLTLSYFYIPWQQISIIGKLPNLEVLILLHKAFEGGEWEMGDGEFPKLKFLKLCGLNIRKWSPSGVEFPPLEQLVLESCQKLKEIPYCLWDITTLKMIEVTWCNSRLEELVKQIHEEQLEFGNHELKVAVNHKGSKSEEDSCHSSAQETKLEEDSYHCSTQHIEQDSESEEDLYGGYFYDTEE